MDKKTKVRAGLLFGISATIFNVVRSLLSHDHLSTKTVLLFVVLALIEGAIEGIVFAWLMGLFVNSRSVKEATKIALETGETILFETGANHFKGAEAVGGKLYLTDKRLVFKSHKFNVQNHELSIGSGNILRVDRYKTLGIVNNGLSVTTAGNKIEKFVVQNPAEWFSRLSDTGDLQMV